MSFSSDATVLFQQNNSQNLAKFQEWLRDGERLLDNSGSLFRVMSIEENRIWNAAIALKKGARDGDDARLEVDEAVLGNVFGGVNAYARKWFVFSRPYVFDRQKVNDAREMVKLTLNEKRRGVAKTPALDDAGQFIEARATGRFLLTIAINDTMRRQIKEILLADFALKKAKIPQNMLADSVRIKKEGGTFTLGIPASYLKTMASNLQAHDISSGGRLTPMMLAKDLVSQEAAQRREQERFARLDAAEAAAGDDAPVAADNAPAANPSWADKVRGGV